MRRMYYLTHDLDSTEQISNDLHQEGISDWNFHVLSKDEAGLYRRHIHSANYPQRLDIIRNAERGAILGLIGALFTTGYVIIAEPFGANQSGLVYVAIFGFVTLFGAWAGGLAGIARENQKIAQYHDEIEAGKFLIMIDVPAGDQGRVQAVMAQKHPEAQLQRIGSTLINPFKFASSTA